MGWLQDPLLFFKVKRGVGFFGATEVGSPFAFWGSGFALERPPP